MSLENVLALSGLVTWSTFTYSGTLTLEAGETVVHRTVALTVDVGNGVPCVDGVTRPRWQGGGGTCVLLGLRLAGDTTPWPRDLCPRPGVCHALDATPISSPCVSHWSHRCSGRPSTVRHLRFA